MGFLSGGKLMSSISKLVENKFTATSADVRLNLLTLVLITLHRGAD